MVTLSELNNYFTVAVHCFTISTSLSIMTEQKAKEYEEIRAIKTYEYENTRNEGKCCHY